MKESPLSTNTRHIGHPVPRVDAGLKVTGQATYSAEYSEPGLLHGAVVLSTIAVGKIVSIDTTAAKAFPGVVEVFTHENRMDVATSDKKWQDDTAAPGHPFRPLDSDKILFDGQPVAFVVADRFETARDAAALVKVQYEAAEAHTDIEAERGNSYVPPTKRNGIAPPPKPRGKAEEAYASAPFKVSADYALEGEHHNPMEMFATTVLWENDKQLTIYDKTQGSQNSQKFVCNVFGLEQDDVRVINAYVGGAFGAGLRPRHQLFLAVMASLQLKRSVRLELTRREMFYLSFRPLMLQTVSLGADANGQLQSVMHDVVSGTSQFEDYQEVVVNWSGLAYRCENVKLGYELAKLDTMTPGDMRAPGAASGLFALESAMDELAYEIDIDPLELRTRNFIHFDQNDDKQLTSKALHACYRQGAERFGWSRRQMQPGSMRDGNELVGWGMATGFWDAMLSPAEAKVRYTGNGQIVVEAAASDIGTGTYTILTQIAAEAFDVAMDQVVVQIGDSTLPTTTVEGGSWTAASTGSAVQAGCQAVIQQILTLAQKTKGSPLDDAKIGDVVIREGRLVLKTDETKGATIADLLAAEGLSSLEGDGSVAPDKMQMMKFISYAHSAVFAEVRVDAELGVVRVTRIVSAIAAGKILNPKTARSQILGGVVMGIGMTLHEEGMWDHRSGRIMNHNLAEYHVPAHADIDDIDVIFVEEFDDKASPIGIKGLGEIGLVGVSAAIANAIFHATGKRQRNLPVTIDKIIDQTMPA
ncbi:xanthine dehydrogenase family protein molybdopterin-binding subunit [Rhizobium sp. VS19-DR104.2]|uniref:xanthine dehydrogenase family protein molybdopterin-binding subunit n=1 Tax=unclassified Rhizobium TaxID=2613769 RepID=UPI001C5B4393|nr:MULTISPECIES: xanthine dehydrogenase family protein molybdopterin-binding subunit [unclassified Rhizobium]MBZ5758983.1 xanthine dehydrogenase family protein molybdopterin-binding subunit [Rhizobium sp. VS19-DR96]MBZ5764187.1 xanthine dehydrogenase family protein molybdopterin-binding subunit [Rhizobium sp. VS19-DR129.2]MBZ5771730.1 xanthine dehydrogenase family protein molybdopterin-binding subunit [Rhizobium sp. VS19-DRK62.2]MBZ5783583.1 xanthine dehydrogenase family protein molybdopterin-b